MTRYILARLVGMVGVLLGVSILIFLLIHFIPGGPFDSISSDKNEKPIPEHIRAALLAKYGLDQPIYVQYIRYMSNALRGDFGISFHTGENVTKFIARTWPVTVQLGLMSLLISWPLAILLGLVAAVRPNTWVDYLTSVFVVTTFVTPVFVIAIMAIILFAVNLKWLPSGGWGSPKHWVLPVLIYAITGIGGLARWVRANMVDALRADYIRTARSKGLTERMVVLRHAFRHASLPLITILSPTLVNILLGSFFIELIFRIPGMGGATTTAIYNRDYPVIMAMILLWTFAITIAYLVTDLLYAWADPRVRLGAKV
jgi:ABC-type dipeptide/oligopeptide/nickel transport system permease component